jgi:hypothetical protein
MPQDVQKIIARLNGMFKNHAEARSVVESEPELQVKGPLPLSEEEVAVSGLIENSVHNLFEQVTKYGVLSYPFESWNPGSKMEYYSTDFAQVCAKRRTAVKACAPEKHPQVLSACVVLFSKSKKVVYLHRRGGRSVTYPSCLHTYGGHFLPVPAWGSHDNESLLGTAVRQLIDEAAVYIPPRPNCPLLVARELPTNFVQLVLLGVDVADAKLGGPQLEGKAEAVRFEDLAATLSDDTWVPSGRMHVLMWLALGAPGIEPPAWPKASTPEQIFEDIARKSLHHERNAGISYDPMNIEIQLIEKEPGSLSSKLPTWHIGRPDCLLKVPHRKGWIFLRFLLQNSGKSFPAECLDNSPRAVIDSLDDVRKDLIASHLENDAWQEKMFKIIDMEWRRADRSNSADIKELIKTSILEFILVLDNIEKKLLDNIKKQNNLNNKKIKSQIEKIKHHKEHIMKKFCDVVEISVEDLDKNIKKYKEDKVKKGKGTDSNRARASQLANRLPVLHPAFLYAPVLLSCLLRQCVTTGEYVIYQPDPANPILWDVP